MQLTNHMYDFYHSLPMPISKPEVDSVVVDVLAECLDMNASDLHSKTQFVPETYKGKGDVARPWVADCLEISLSLQRRLGIDLDDDDVLAAMFARAPKEVVRNAQAEGYVTSVDEKSGAVEGASVWEGRLESTCLTVGRLQEYVFTMVNQQAELSVS